MKCRDLKCFNKNNWLTLFIFCNPCCMHRKRNEKTKNISHVWISGRSICQSGNKWKITQFSSVQKTRKLPPANVYCFFFALRCTAWTALKKIWIILSNSRNVLTKKENCNQSNGTIRRPFSFWWLSKIVENCKYIHGFSLKVE